MGRIKLGKCMRGSTIIVNVNIDSITSDSSTTTTDSSTTTTTSSTWGINIPDKDLYLLQLAFEPVFYEYFSKTNKFSSSSLASYQQIFAWDSSTNELILSSGWEDRLHLATVSPLGGEDCLKMFQLQLTTDGASWLNGEDENMSYKINDSIRNNGGATFNISYNAGQYLATMGIAII
jgi:hypothetical protein